MADLLCATASVSVSVLCGRVEGAGRAGGGQLAHCVQAKCTGPTRSSSICCHAWLVFIPPPLICPVRPTHRLCTRAEKKEQDQRRKQKRRD